MRLHPLFAALLLAGCASPAAVPDAPSREPSPAAAPAVVLHEAGGARLDAPAGDLLARGAQYFLGAVSYEPTLGIDAEGRIYMTADREAPVPVLNAPPTVMRSDDKGLTWTDVGPWLAGGVSRHPTSFDPYVLVDRATGRVFMDDIVPVGCGMLSWSDDQGGTWDTNPHACGNAQVNDHQTLVTAKPRRATTMGYPHVVYRCVNNLAYAGCATSLDGGRTFLPQVPAFEVATNDCAAVTGHLAADAEGRVFLPLGWCSKGSVVVVTEDDGLTWKAHRVDPKHPADQGEHDLEIAVDEAGNLYAFWTHGGQVWMSRSLDHGQTWTEGRNVTAPGVTATMFNAAAAAGPGKVALAYVGTTLEGGYANAVGDGLLERTAAAWEDATWNAYLALVTDALADDFAVLTVTVNDPADPVARGVCGRTRCDGMGDFIDLEIDPEGRPWAAFVDVCTQKCVTDPKARNDRPAGFVGTLVEGPSLLAAGGRLAPLPPPPAPAPGA